METFRIEDTVNANITPAFRSWRKSISVDETNLRRIKSRKKVAMVGLKMVPSPALHFTKNMKKVFFLKWKKC